MQVRQGCRRQQPGDESIFRAKHTRFGKLLSCVIDGRAAIVSTSKQRPPMSAQVLRLSAVGFGLLYGSVKLKHYQVRSLTPRLQRGSADPSPGSRRLQAHDHHTERLLVLCSQRQRQRRQPVRRKAITDTA